MAKSPISSTAFANLTSSYMDQVWELRDRRLDGYTLMGTSDPSTFASSVYTIVVICTAYVVLVAGVGPKLMSFLPPLRLRGLMLIYNLAQVAGNLAIVWVGVPLWIRTGVDFICKPLGEDSNDPDFGGIANLSYYFFSIKFLDLFDTVFLVARKNHHQLSFLHVYHHFLMPLYLWPSIRFAPGGNNLLPSLVNSGIHVFMYSYYFLTALGIKRSGWLMLWKKLMTSAQIAQFVFLASVSLAQLLAMEGCDFPAEQTVVNFVVFMQFLALFTHFFHEEYVKKANRRAAEQNQQQMNGYVVKDKME